MKKLRILLYANKFYYVLLLISLIYVLIFTKIIKYESQYTEEHTNFKIIVFDMKIDGNKLTITGSDKEKLVVNYYFNTLKEKKYYENNLDYGDYLIVKGNLTIPKSNTILNGFNYKEYLYNNKIYYILNASEVELINTNNLFYKFKNYVYRKTLKLNNSDYLNAFILGNKDLIDENINNSYSYNGISHLFALSGMHVNLFAMIILIILKKVKISEFKKYFIVFLILIIYSFIANFSPSIVRASVFFFLQGINKYYKLNIDTSNLLIIIFFIYVIINPFVVYSLSFILSFTITYFIMISLKVFKTKNKLLSSLYISFIAFISSIPIIINNFNTVNLMGIIYNLFFIPFVSCIIFPLSLIVFFIPILDNILSFCINIMENISLFLTQFKLLTINLPKINILLVIIYYILLFTMLKKKKLYIILILTSILLITYITPYLDNNTYIYFIDVSQGDSALIVTKNNKRKILIDTGGTLNFNEESWKKRKKSYSLCKDKLIPFFKSIGINNIDYMYLTHGDIDHIGESSCLIQNYKINNIFINQGEINNLEKGLENYLVYDDNYIKVENVEIYLLNDKIYDNENDNSLILLIKIYNYKLLFMGDASIVVEEDIISKYNLNNIDILKVGHHGSKSSTSELFINNINPKYSVISAKENNIYNHPNESVIKTLEKYNSKILYTMYDGTIKITINNNLFKITSYPPY